MESSFTPASGYDKIVLENGTLRTKGLIVRSLLARREKGRNGQMTEDERYMKAAMAQARKAAALEEVPIGCVIVQDGKIIGRGYNKRNFKKHTLAHAELIAIHKATKVVGDWRLEGCTLYVTLEPCPMCAGAIVQSRLDRVVIGSMNPKAGCAGSVLNLLDQPGFNHRPQVTYDVLQPECSNMLSAFFKELRQKKKAHKAAEAEQAAQTEYNTEIDNIEQADEVN